MEEYLISSEPTKPNEYEVSSLDQFIKLITWFSLDGRVIFRGLSNESHSLIPSAGRYPGLLENEKKILEDFKREAIPYIKFVPENDWQWLALAQHNRLPTRLLDWTTNPLVALWFAVKDAPCGEVGAAVWAYLYDEGDVVYSSGGKESPFEINSSHLYFPEHVFPSIQAQNGLFTVHPKIGNEEAFQPMDKCFSDTDLTLKKIHIPESLFPTFYYNLSRVGVSASTLFPGLYGIVERIRYENINREDEKPSR